MFFVFSFSFFVLNYVLKHCCFFVCVDFPLYSEALKFFKHRDQMVRIAVRTLTLNVFAVNDPDLRRFITDRSAVPYFSNMVWFIKDQCIALNDVLHKAIHPNPRNSKTLPQNKLDEKENKDDKNENTNDNDDGNNDKNKDKDNEKTKKKGNKGKNSHGNASLNGKSKSSKSKSKGGNTIMRTPATTVLSPHTRLQRGVEEQVDHYYYLEDIFALGIRPLSETLIDQLISHFILPVLFGSLIDDTAITLNKNDEKKDQTMDSKNSENGNNSQATEVDNGRNGKDDDNDDNDDNGNDESNEVDGVSDRQNASTQRKIMQQRTRIHKQLASFLLTQVRKSDAKE